MWSDEAFIDLCVSSERVRDAWIKQRRRSRTYAGVSALILMALGFWLNGEAPRQGGIALFAAILALLHVQRVTTDIRMLGLGGWARRAERAIAPGARA